MYFDSLEALLHMDGHGPYVWAAYAITCVVLLSMLSLPRRRARQQLQQLAGELKRQQGAPTAKEES
jgi:heme exporter protein D